MGCSSRCIFGIYPCFIDGAVSYSPYISLEKSFDIVGIPGIYFNLIICIAYIERRFIKQSLVPRLKIYMHFINQISQFSNFTLQIITRTLYTYASWRLLRS